MTWVDVFALLAVAMGLAVLVLTIVLNALFELRRQRMWKRWAEKVRQRKWLK